MTRHLSRLNAEPRFPIPSPAAKVPAAPRWSEVGPHFISPGEGMGERRRRLPFIRTKPPRGVRARVLLGVAAGLGVWLGIAGHAARAYDPATTNAGLTERAVVASTLHEVLAHRLGRTLGLFESLSLGPVAGATAAPRSDADTHAPATVERRLLWGRLLALDPAAGYRPLDDGSATALSWVMAGSVIAKTPPERLQNLFFDPSTKMGLRDASALDDLGHGLRLAADSGGLRAMATGTAFSFEGLSALDWLESPTNDLGLPVLFSSLEQAVAAPERADREAALVRGLLSLGGVLTVLEDMGNPAQVRNDFRAAYLRGGSGSPFDRASAYEQAVADRYGVIGVPGPKAVVRRPTWKEYFSGADGQGLADRTQRRFFSDGTVPEDAPIDRDTSTLDVLGAVRQSLTYALPGVPRLDLRPLGQVQYVLAPDDAPGAPPRALLAYQRVPGRVRFFLDQRVYGDTARVVLPEIAGYAAGLVDHLFRARIGLHVSGGRVQARVGSADGGGTRAPRGEVRLLAEDAGGRRREIGRIPVGPGQGSDGMGGPGTEDVGVAVPADARRVVAFLRGDDGAGPVVAFAVLAWPQPVRGP